MIDIYFFVVDVCQRAFDAMAPLAHEVLGSFDQFFRITGRLTVQSSQVLVFQQLGDFGRECCEIAGHTFFVSAFLRLVGVGAQVFKQDDQCSHLRVIQAQRFVFDLSGNVSAMNAVEAALTDGELITNGEVVLGDQEFVQAVVQTLQDAQRNGVQEEFEVLGKLAVLLLVELDGLHELADALVYMQRNDRAFFAIAGQVRRQLGQCRDREAA